MLNKEDIVLHFRSKIDASYRDELERLFFFNWNQSRYASRITKSVKDYPKPVIVEEGEEIALVFKDRTIGQTLHIFDSEDTDASLIGVVMYERDTKERITVVHLALHERCRQIFKSEGINVAAIVMDELFSIFSKIKGIKKVRVYYIDKEINLETMHLSKVIGDK